MLVVLLVVGCTDEASHAPTNGAPRANAPLADPNSAESKKAMRVRSMEMKQDEQTREEALWFGKTGLPDDEERELPRYLRREYGQTLSQPNSLKASDLTYLGVFQEGIETVHYWRINDGEKEPHFAYIVIAPKEREVIGWGDRKAPEK